MPEKTVRGKVVSEKDGARFVPDNDQAARLRLTGAAYEQAITPDAEEIDLSPYVGKSIQCGYERISAPWVWRATGVHVVT